MINIKNILIASYLDNSEYLLKSSSFQYLKLHKLNEHIELVFYYKFKTIKSLLYIRKLAKFNDRFISEGCDNNGIFFRFRLDDKYRYIIHYVDNNCDSMITRYRFTKCFNVNEKTLAAQKSSQGLFFIIS